MSLDLGGTCLAFAVQSALAAVRDRELKRLQSVKTMKILMIGGTVFIGRHLVSAALEQNHDVTIFTRGRHNPDLFSEVEHLQGDRRQDLSALQGRDWDAVIDTCGYLPKVVAASVDALIGHVGQYVFLSTINTYAFPPERGFTEESPTVAIPDQMEEKTFMPDTYGPFKVLCEQEVRRGFEESSLILRLGYMFGPHDRPGRFAYWPARMALGGQVLAPSPRDAPLQLADARDSARWTISMIEEGRNGLYNVVGDQATMEETLNSCRDVVKSDAELIWVSPDVLLDADIAWKEVPAWQGPDAANYDLMRADGTKARKAGLTFRPLKDTIRDIYQAYLELPESEQREEFILTAQREQEIIASAV